MIASHARAAPTRVLIVDDSPTMRAMVAHSLSRYDDIEVIGCADGQDCAAAAAGTSSAATSSETPMPFMSSSRKTF